ncbi:MAG TPA: choice-of-anchor tandem repeat GloVer-containing protein [Opitutaceae bacterium]|nr:choice-of-anchor tandem repeat GloVer-containing protein [Opitutaceae bacterium]
MSRAGKFGCTLKVAGIACGLGFAASGRLSAQTLQTLCSGLAVSTAPIQGADGRLYGTTGVGGANNAGFIFAVNIDGTGLQNLHSFPPGVVSFPYSGAGLIQGTDGRLYGTTSGDATAPDGGVFAVNTDGTGFTLLHAFSGGDGSDPQDGLVQGTDGRLYGTTWGGGAGAAGTIFAVAPDGTGFASLYSFPNYPAGVYPWGLIEGSDGRLYGTTLFGGADSRGTLFALNRDGTGFSTLHDFGATGDGGMPGPIIQGRDGRLYGPTQISGANGFGSLFAVNSDGSGYTTLCSFDGSTPFAIMQAADGRLYGATSIGYLEPDYAGAPLPPPSFGTLFSVQTDGTGFVTLFSSAEDMADTGLLQASNGRFYGVAGQNLYALALPADDTQPLPQTLAAGAATVLTAGVATGGSTFQWQLNGVNIAGATGATLPLVPIGAADAGQYSVQVTGPSGAPTETIAAATLTVTVDAQLLNGSARGWVDANQDLVAGFALGGPTAQELLLRGIGPALAQYGVTQPLAVPKLTLFDDTTAPIAIDSGWSNPPVAGISTLPATIDAATAAIFSQDQAFPLPAGSADCALAATLPPGAYTIHVAGTGGSTGIGLAEIYAGDWGSAYSRLANLSALGFAGSGPQALVAGFVISGTTSETLLVRGVGPALSQYGVSAALQAPQLTLYNAGGIALATNAGWGNAPVIPSLGLFSVPETNVGLEPASASIMNAVGAFPLPAASADCAMVVTLPPGAYTVQVAGWDGTSGVALLEVYDLP